MHVFHFLLSTGRRKVLVYLVIVHFLKFVADCEKLNEVNYFLICDCLNSYTGIYTRTICTILLTGHFIVLFPVSIGLVWGSDKADPELAAEVTRTIGTTILFPDVSPLLLCSSKP